MKKFLLIGWIVFGLILAGCGQQGWLSKDELFEKKQECANYKSNIEKSIEEENSKNLNAHKYLEEIFYSTKKNSCLYTYTTSAGENISHFLVDYLTNEVVIWYNEKTSSIDRFKEFDNTVKEFKWE